MFYWGSDVNVVQRLFTSALSIEVLPVVPPSDCRGRCCCCFCSQTGIPVYWYPAELAPVRPRSTEARSGPLLAKAADSTALQWSLRVQQPGGRGDSLTTERGGAEGGGVEGWVRLQSDWPKYGRSLLQCCSTQDPHHPINWRSQEH